MGELLLALTVLAILLLLLAEFTHWWWHLLVMGKSICRQVGSSFSQALAIVQALLLALLAARASGMR